MPEGTSARVRSTLHAALFVPMLWRMNRPNLVRRALSPAVAAALSLTTLLYVSAASAGTARIHDRTSLLSAADRGQIEAAARREPFDVDVITTNDYADQAAFSRYIGSQVNAPNEVVIGIDSVHHHTQVHFGTGSHVAQGEWANIERAGNSDFHDGHWGAGVAAIADSAASAVSRGTSSGSTPVSSDGGSGWGILGLLFVVGIPILGILLIVMVIRRFTSGVRSGYGPGYGGPGYGGPGYGGPGYGGGGYPGGGMGPVGGGLIGAGLGGIAGYELGKAAGEREEQRNDGGGVFGGDSGDSGGGGNFDAGGGGSDFGGGDSGGGGGDFGGGGGDSGGGGSDW
jgi:hypothetical protein